MGKTTFELTCGPQDIGLSTSFDKTRVRRLSGGRYQLELDDRDQQDRRTFSRLIEKRAVELHGLQPAVLARFDPGFADAGVQDLLKQLIKARTDLPKLERDRSTAIAETEIMKAAVSENSDPDRVELLFREMKKKQESAELAKVRAETQSRHIASLESRLLAELKDFRRKEAAKTRVPLDKAADEFNKNIADAYGRFWSVAEELFPSVAAMSPDPFPPEVHYASPHLGIDDGRNLKTMRAFPQIGIAKDRLEFRLETMKEKKS